MDKTDIQYVRSCEVLLIHMQPNMTLFVGFAIVAVLQFNTTYCMISKQV